MKRRYILILAVFFVASIFAGANLLLQERPLTTQHPLELQRPNFVDIAHAEESNPVNIGNKLDEEAGISAYYKAPSSINLNQIESLFTTIELQTSDYTIGSIAVPGYAEHYHTHVYVHRDGWILAYYLREAQAAKIADVKSKTIDTTILKNIVGTVASAAGAPFSDVTYYDFRYPNATNMLFVAEAWDGGDNKFEITLPPEYGYLEMSWAVYNISNLGVGFVIDGKQQFGSETFWNGSTAYGPIAITDLLPGSPHEIAVDDYAVLVILYRVP